MSYNYLHQLRENIMTKAYIIEARLIDHPDYETFVGVKGSKEAAEKHVISQLQEDIDDMGEGEIITTVTSDTCTRYEVSGDGSVMFISEHDI